MSTPRQKAEQDQWRSGSTAGQKRAALNAKATLAYLREHPKSTKEEIRAAIGCCNLLLLKEHNLAYYEMSGGAARWSVNLNPAIRNT